MERISERSEILMESLRYVKTFHSKTFVIKYGKSGMIDDELKKSIIQDIILLKYIGINPVIVHGGDPLVNKYLEKMNIKTQYVNEHRISDQETIEMVQMVLVGKINLDLVSLINLYGGKGIGLTGKDANIIVARKHPPELFYNSEKKKEEYIDLQYVGEIERIDPSTIISLCKSDFIPVISPIGVGINGETYNINADKVAGGLASALKAEKLIILSDVDGLYEVPANKLTKISTLAAVKARQMLSNNQIDGGMIPKIKACVKAVENGVKSAHIIDSKEKHSLLFEVFTDKGLGTMVSND